MANPKLQITYQDPNAKALCRLTYFGADDKEVPNTIVTEQRHKDADGVEGWSPAGSRMPIEIAMAHVLAAVGRGEATPTVDKKTGTVKVDASKVAFPI